jgi:hypothetical protein
MKVTTKKKTSKEADWTMSRRTSTRQAVQNEGDKEREPPVGGDSVKRKKKNRFELTAEEERDNELMSS